MRWGVNRLLNKPAPIRHRYVIVRTVHPSLKATRGYYANHPYKVWHWVKKKSAATCFNSEHQANVCAEGSDLHRFTHYKIERF